ncbi:MAG TPA: hypothetical protein VMR34_01700 [Candidatus Saccharimonadales bacterium]|nr:hypothetical protein [Candidatus Saccharimonadales bacterium]
MAGVQYVSSETEYDRVYQLFEKGTVPSPLSRVQLKALRLVAVAAFRLICARNRKALATSAEDRWKTHILGIFPVGLVPGFVAKYGQKWIKVFVLPQNPTVKVAMPVDLIEHLGAHLDEAAASVTIRVTPGLYYTIRDLLLANKGPNLKHFAVDVDCDQKVVNRVLAERELPPLPTGVFDVGEPPNPKILASIVQSPK